jgi:hypothetical protein
VFTALTKLLKIEVSWSVKLKIEIDAAESDLG